MTATSTFVATARDTAAAYLTWGRVRAGLALPRPAPAPARDRRLLLLAWAFPPVVTGGIYRPLALVQHAARRGWEVQVLAGAPEGPIGAAGAQLLRTVPADADVLRVPETSLRPGHSWFPRIDGGFVTALEAYRAGGRHFRARPPRVVLASGPPFHLFVTGSYLARRFHCPLVLDYRDEWTENPFDFVRPGSADLAWERRCLEQAAAVVFTTRSQREHQLRVFPGLSAAKAVVIPNGWDAVGPARPAAGRPAEPLVLSYIGHLGPHTPPDAFLSRLAEVVARRPDLPRRLRVRFVGKRTPGCDRRLRAFPWPDMIELIDHVPKSEADRLMRESAGLLLLNDVRLDRYLPGKLFEYLAALRPIVAFGEGGECAALLRQLGTGLVVPDADSRALEEALARLACPAPDPPATLQSWLAAHTRERCAAALLDLLGRVLEAPTR